MSLHRQMHVGDSSQLVPDATLERLASKQGLASAEAYVVLELREARSSGDQVFAFRANGRYTLGTHPRRL